jgi:hypothetical protein
MATESRKGSKLIGSRVFVLAGLLATMLVGLSRPAWAAPALQVDPTSGPGGTQVTVTGSGFSLVCPIYLSFTDANGTVIQWAILSGSVSFQAQEVIPAVAANGSGTVKAVQQLDFRGRCMFQRTASALFTVTQSTQLLGNPGFENGSASPAPWVTTARINNTSAEPPRSGSWDAWLAGTGTTHTDSLYQDVAIPGGISTATLSFYLHIDTADTGSSLHDLLKLQVRNPSNAVLATLATYSNLNAASGYVQKTFDLTSYAGQTVRVFLVGREDASLQTSFVVDDFALPTA